MATHDFQLPQSSWAEQKKMLQAYVMADTSANGGPVEEGEVVIAVTAGGWSLGGG